MLVSFAFQQLWRNLHGIYPVREARNIAEIILEEVWNVRNAEQSQRVLTADEQQRLAHITQRLLDYEPWQYVLGVADFYGMKFKVSPAVLVPRPETEELVLRIVDDHRSHPSPLRILDIGTGSGCIAISLQKNLPQAQVAACDLSEAALAVARENAAQNRTSVSFFSLDILNETACAAHTEQYDLIVSNPPYITHAEVPYMDDSVRIFEPEMALFVTNNDPLQFYRAIAHFAQTHLAEKGSLYAELNPSFAQQVLDCWKQALPSARLSLHQDIYGKDRMARAVLL